MYDLAVIGSGPGGYEAAAHAAAMGKRVALFEKDALGGTCLNIGCIPTKALLRSGLAYTQCQHAEAFGIQVGEVSYDWQAMQQRCTEMVQTLGKGVSRLLADGGVEVVSAQACLAAADTVRADGQEYRAQHVLLATGSRPVQPPIPGIGQDSVLTSAGVFTLPCCPEKLVVIGAGIIGLEFACFFAEMGTEVTVVEQLPHVAPGIDPDIRKRLRSVVKRKGITVHTSSRVTAIEEQAVTMTDAAGEERCLETSYVLNSTGRQPVIEDVGLEQVGLRCENGAVRTDEKGRTNVPGVWACGDVTGRRLLAHAATREGKVAVNNMFARPDRMRYQAVPSVMYTHPEVAWVGAHEATLQQQGVDYRTATVPMAMAGRFLIEHPGESGTVKVLLDNAYGRVLGVHMIGDHCGEHIAAAAAMVELELRADDVDELVFPHPTISEALKEAVVQGGSQ